MGRKYIRKGKHVLLYIAGLSFFLYVGCTTLHEVEKKNSARDGLMQGRVYLAEGNFEGALNENRIVLDLIESGPPRDRALFNMGLIYAHSDYPGKDYNKSRSYFDALVKEFPESPLVDDARIWRGILDVINRTINQKSESEQEIVRLNKKISGLNHLLAGKKFMAGGDYRQAMNENLKTLEDNDRSPEAAKALFNLGLIYVHYENPDKDFNKAAGYFRRLLENYPESSLAGQAKIWLGLLNIIEKTKQVDIEIEKKKKELAE